MSTDTANGRRSGAAGAALDVLLTDAAVGNPAARVLTEPAGIVRAAVKVAARPDRAVRLGGSRRFVLSTSGHIQALINPPGPDSRSSFRVAEELPAAEGEFLRETPTTSGSWWPDYASWLAVRAGERKPSRKTLGNAKYKPTAKAPGSYVHAS